MYSQFIALKKRHTLELAWFALFKSARPANAFQALRKYSYRKQIKRIQWSHALSNYNKHLKSRALFRLQQFNPCSAKEDQRKRLATSHR
jgi:hypothetical protein